MADCSECERIWGSVVTATSAGLCAQCDELRTNRHALGLVVDWVPLEHRLIVTGQAASGKSWYVGQQSDCIVWDMDVAAKELGYRGYPRLTRQQRVLDARRQRFIEAAKRDKTDQRYALIFESVTKAFEVAKELRGRLVHVWCSEKERGDRLEARRQCTKSKQQRVPKK